MAKRGKPANRFIADLSAEFGSPLAILMDSHNIIIATQCRNGDWGGSANKYYPPGDWTYALKKIREMFVQKKTKKAANVAELLENVRDDVEESNKVLVAIAAKLNGV